jgi:hypothetical protein
VSNPTSNRETLREFVEDVAGMDCISYTKHLQEHPCGVCVSCRARAVLGTSETPANPYSRTTDAGLWAFQERFGHVPMSAGDQQWVNGYARALQHMRTDSVPESPPKTGDNAP